MTLTRKWSLLAVVLAGAVFAAGWFLLIAPKRSEAADLRDQAVAQEDANARLEQKLAVLKAQQEDLPKQRARLAVIQTQIPDNPALPTLIRDLTAAGRKTGATISALAPAAPVPVVTAAVVPVVAESDGEAAAPTTPAASLFQVPLEVKVGGSYFELEQFVNKLEGLKRSFLVTGFTLSEPTDPEAAAGDLLLSLQGRVFLAPPAAETSTTPQPVASAPAGQ
jgi:type IV pilus assembly protein PilO